MEINGGEKLMSLLAQYAMQYGDDCSPNMTIRELADDLYTSEPYAEQNGRFMIDYHHVKTVFV